MNDSHAGDRNSKSVPAGDTDQNLGADTINQPSEVETIQNNQTERLSFGLVADEINLLILH